MGRRIWEKHSVNLFLLFICLFITVFGFITHPFSKIYKATVLTSLQGMCQYHRSDLFNCIACAMVAIFSTLTADQSICVCRGWNAWADFTLGMLHDFHQRHRWGFYISWSPTHSQTTGLPQHVTWMSAISMVSGAMLMMDSSLLLKKTSVPFGDEIPTWELAWGTLDHSHALSLTHLAGLLWE